MATDDISFADAGTALENRLVELGSRLSALEAEHEGDTGHSEPRTDAEINALIDTRLEDYFSPGGDGEGEGDKGEGDLFLAAFDEHVISLIDEHATEGVGESEVINLINEHAAGFPEDRLEAIDQELENIRDAIGMVRGGVTSTIGPEVPDADGGYFHSTPGWGTIVSISEPRQFRECTVVSNQAGEFTAELWEYTDDGNAGERVDHTDINVVSDGEHDVDLDLQAPEAGTYLLTRDYERGKSTISLWRTTGDWDGWGNIDQSLTLKTSAHPDFGGEPKYWYYFFACDVLPYYPDEN